MSSEDPRPVEPATTRRTRRAKGGPAGGGPTRREQILTAAAGKFARHGFRGVGIDDIGAAVGITGPALYRHFRNKDAMLAEMLTGISDKLLDGGRERVRAASDPGRGASPLGRRV